MTFAVLASGTPTYSDISDIVEALVNTEGRRYPIPGYDHEDIAQEIRVECLRVLPFFDAARIGPSPYKYLQTCVRNFLYNMRRGIWVPNNPPCVRCPLWDRIRRTCTIDEIGCEKIVQYRENMAAKADLRKPTSLEDDVLDNYQDEQTEAMLLDQSIRGALPPRLLPFYDKMLVGEKIPARTKREIRLIVTEIINNA
jgi:DNA-directed RNA polymerase specialized sigma24 family protein